MKIDLKIKKLDISKLESYLLKFIQEKGYFAEYLIMNVETFKNLQTYYPNKIKSFSDKDPCGVINFTYYTFEEYDIAFNEKLDFGVINII